MELSLIQKDILITLITLYHQQSHSIKGEEIADMIMRNPGTVRNQMQSLKAIGLVDGVPGPKGGYIPTELAYKELNLNVSGGDYDVPISRDGVEVKGVHVQEVDFTTLCHPDICHAVIKLVGSSKIFDIGDKITIGPTPVNKLLIRGEVFGKDEVKQSLLIATSEMISLPKQPIKAYMSTPLLSLASTSTLRDAVALFTREHIHGAPVIDGEHLAGIVTMSDITKALDQDLPLKTPVSKVMTKEVVEAPSDIKLFEVVRRFKEREIGRLIVTENNKPVGILTQSDVIRVIPSL
ncbi:CBS domain-containing protein [Methanoregula sp. UBA64]|jgi:transcriptional regulator|uniref:CBS domain-containing protein n=1 Tax=Methanoregula sp. UBA64 TaxID=1915554 RepID=UPI0025D84B80|nr:CBS domain-containing protein [Methanoregula sp. UBA64]